MITPPTALARFAEASALLASVRDIIDERPDGDAPPAWCTRRGWSRFCAALPESFVLLAERDGLAAHLAAVDAPDDLIELARDALRVTTLPALTAPSTLAVDGRRASPRKRVQVAAFAQLAERVSRGASRVVDVGSGHGHLTRHLAQALGLPAEGWERDPARVAVASALDRDGSARFIAVDASALTDTLRASDLVVGLHACGELGDHATRAVIAAGASLALVGCCLQKRPAGRVPLGLPEGVEARALTLGRGVLGLGNACDGDEGVEENLAVRTTSRVHREGLRIALRDAGVALPVGAEMRGVNRRRATGDFHELVAHAFAARGLVAPSRGASEHALRVARVRYESTRRFTLPRMMLARLVEVWVALDRAALLARNGYAVEVCAAFDVRTSPRNIAVVASAPHRPTRGTVASPHQP